MEKKRLSTLVGVICLTILAASALPIMTGCGPAQPAGKIRVGITQIITHPALDANRQGFIDQLAEEGFVEGENIEYDSRNPEGDMTLAASIAQKFVLDKVDQIGRASCRERV